MAKQYKTKTDRIPQKPDLPSSGSLTDGKLTYKFLLEPSSIEVAYEVNYAVNSVLDTSEPDISFNSAQRLISFDILMMTPGATKDISGYMKTLEDWAKVGAVLKMTLGHLSEPRVSINKLNITTKQWRSGKPTEARASISLLVSRVPPKIPKIESKIAKDPIIVSNNTTATSSTTSSSSSDTPRIANVTPLKSLIPEPALGSSTDIYAKDSKGGNSITVTGTRKYTEKESKEIVNKLVTALENPSKAGKVYTFSSVATALLKAAKANSSKYKVVDFDAGTGIVTFYDIYFKDNNTPKQRQRVFSKFKIESLKQAGLL